ncbi:MAG: hypothetical protein NCW75_07460 [Phycisphaera sp.]|nr:MAG: hypothetical protein NCW75_07460 [Phycisphaera sp.]
MKPTRTTARSGRRRLGPRRRGVVSVLSMMFLILFGSLAAAMAVVSQGNLRTAAAHLHVSRAMSSAETGLSIAEGRLDEAVTRFVIDRGRIDQTLGEQMWIGAIPADVDTVVRALPSGDVPTGVANGLAIIHDDDQNTVNIDGIVAPILGAAPIDVDLTLFAEDNWLYTPAVGLVPQDPDADPRGQAYQITYAPLANGTDIRIIVTGFDFDHMRGGVPLTRTISKDFRMAKRVEHTVISPNKIMIGKNVMIDGDLGSTFTDMTYNFGDPMLMRSDFRHLHPDLDEKLDALNVNISRWDIDNDNRMRVGHPDEGQGAGLDLDGDGTADESALDVNNDGYIDEFDLFLKFYDTNGDGRVALSDALRAGTPGEFATAEFIDGSGRSVDDSLALLIDSAKPDRNRNGVHGFVDINGDGVWQPGDEPLQDVDPYSGLFADQVLGYRDGFIDGRDLYRKVDGTLSFRANRSDWESFQGPVEERLQGPIDPDEDAAMTFGATEDSLPELTTDRFTKAKDQIIVGTANGDPFLLQAAQNLGLGTIAELLVYVETGTDPDAPQFHRLDPDLDGDGRPDNWATAYFEKSPFNSPNFTDWYYRPVFINMTFKDAVLDPGLNALFINCTFVGITYVRTESNNEHLNWELYGKMSYDSGLGRPQPDAPRVAVLDPTEYPDDVLPATALPPAQGFFIPQNPFTQALDKADFLKNSRPVNFDDLLEPIVIGGRRVTDTKLISNNIRFHDCMFIGSIVSDTPLQYTPTRNKLQYTGATRFLREHPDPDKQSDERYRPDSDDEELIDLSSMMLPGYSVDLGTFNSPPTQDVQLGGVIVAGVMDIRGNASIDGALLMTFKPQPGVAPLVDQFGVPVGNPAMFNTTLGYFGPDDGDSESLDPSTLPEAMAVDPVTGELRMQKIVGYDTDGDGLADVAHDQTPPDGAVPVPFYGYGRVYLKFNPDMTLPDGIMLPVQLQLQRGSYQEGRP